MSGQDKEFEDYSAEDGLSGKLAAINDVEVQRRVEALRSGLEQYDLDDADRGLLERDHDSIPDKATYLKPILVVAGRPNVGKSTLVNRILGCREAVVEDVPGVTRDRVSYSASWNAKEFTLVDTGGWEVDAEGVYSQVAEQAEYAVSQADAVLLVVDAVVGITAMDEAIVKMLHRAHKPVLLVANKVDDERTESDAAALWALGLGEPYPVSSLHGRGTADMLDAALGMLADHSAVTGTEYGLGPRSVALVGRPNVGKSSLLNKLAGQNRVVVDNQAGTTRDPVDEVIELGGIPLRFVDTAGIRRRVHLQHGSDYYASLRTQIALDRAEVAIVLLEADQGVSEQDVRVVQKVLDAGRALVLVFNKWDLLDEENRRLLERSIERDLAHVSWAPRVNISARTGWHKDKLVPALETAFTGWDNRVSTGRLNAFLGEFMAAHPHPLRGGKQPRILFGTQASAQPPKFVLFTTGFLDAGYRRFLVRLLRETFNFEGTPVEISMRVRQKRFNKNSGARR